MEALYDRHKSTQLLVLGIPEYDGIAYAFMGFTIKSEKVHVSVLLKDKSIKTIEVTNKKQDEIWKLLEATNVYYEVKAQGRDPEQLDQKFNDQASGELAYVIWKRKEEMKKR